MLLAGVTAGRNESNFWCDVASWGPPGYRAADSGVRGRSLSSTGFPFFPGFFFRFSFILLFSFRTRAGDDVTSGSNGPAP